MENKLKATVKKAVLLPDVPSGSAIQVVNDALFIVSDDATYVYRLSLDGQLQDSVRLKHLPEKPYRIPKPIKPDYEASVHATIKGRNCLIAFGSGSLRPQRDSGAILSLEDSGQKIVSLSALYEAMRKQAGIEEADFNIEAAALHAQMLILFNRGTNHAFCMDWQKIAAHLVESGPLSALKVSQLKLPKSGKYSAGISGSCSLDAKRLLFSASAEATTDWVADGEVLGSYVGIMEMEADGALTLLDIAPIISTTGKAIKDKVEGIEKHGRHDGSTFTVLGVVDNDDGSSQLLEIILEHVPLL